MNDGWISVKERLPESYETVLICAYSEENDNYGYTTGNYFDLHDYVDSDDDDTDGWCFDNELMYGYRCKAVAWMPISQYKEESK